MENQWVVAGLISISITIIGKIVFDWLNSKRPQKVDTNGMEKQIGMAIKNSLEGIHCPLNHSNSIGRIESIHDMSIKMTEKTIGNEIHLSNMVTELKESNKLLHEIKENLRKE